MAFRVLYESAKQEIVYEKCAHCHLFVELNDIREDEDATGAALYVHLDNDNEIDMEISESHNAEPSGMLATLSVWREYGPRQMQVSFNQEN